MEFDRVKRGGFVEMNEGIVAVGEVGRHVVPGFTLGTIDDTDGPVSSRSCQCRVVADVLGHEEVIAASRPVKDVFVAPVLGGRNRQLLHRRIPRARGDDAPSIRAHTDECSVRPAGPLTDELADVEPTTCFHVWRRASPMWLLCAQTIPLASDP